MDNGTQQPGQQTQYPSRDFPVASAAIRDLVTGICNVLRESGTAAE